MIQSHEQHEVMTIKETAEDLRATIYQARGRSETETEEALS